MSPPFNNTTGSGSRRSSPGFSVEALAAEEFEAQAQDGTADQATREVGGMVMRKSEPLVVLTKSGNLLEGTRWRKGEAEPRNRRKER